MVAHPHFTIGRPVQQIGHGLAPLGLWRMGLVPNVYILLGSRSGSTLMSRAKRIRYFGVFLGVFALTLGLLGGISAPAYMALMPMGVTVIVTGLSALLGFVALAALLLIFRAR